MQRDDMRLTQQLIQRQIANAFSHCLLVWIVSEHFHPERERQVNNALPYLAGSDHTKGFVFQFKSAPPFKGKASLLFYFPRFDDAA
jgi:hypothetical protein